MKELKLNIMQRAKELNLECDPLKAQELAALIQQAYEESAQDVALEMLMHSMQEVRASME